MLIDRANTQWSIDFINVVVNAPHGLERIEEFLSNKIIFHRLYDGDPYKIYTYEDMMWDNPDQNICKKNEIVLSIDFVGYEEEIQVLTYDQLKEFVIMVLREKPNGDEQINEFIKRVT
ncbi:MAG: hypothetical protein K2K44_09845 [Oscillospiraceae bacterium]|nr:hypothetical protein [Oscillospiraceae bacterium]